MAQENGSGNGNGNGRGKINPGVLAGERPDKAFAARQFPVNSLDDVLTAIRRAGGTGKLEINFRNGQARGEAKWQGYIKKET